MSRKNGSPLNIPMREPLGYSDDRVYCTEQGELCTGCPYPRHGLSCFFQDGTCLRTEMKKSPKGFACNVNKN